MTTVTEQKQTLLQRLWKVVRINTVRPWALLALPLVIITVLLSVTAIFAYLTIAFVSVDAQFWFSPEIFLVIYLFIYANQISYQDFPISLSYGISRRDFYLGSILTFGLLSVWYAAISIAIASVAGTFFLMEISGVGFVEFLSLIVLFMGTQVLSASITNIYLRWGKPGMLTFFGILALVLISMPVLAITNAGEGLPGLNIESVELLGSIGVGFGLTMLLAVLGYLTIRRAAVS